MQNISGAPVLSTVRGAAPGARRKRRFPDRLPGNLHPPLKPPACGVYNAASLRSLGDGYRSRIRGTQRRWNRAMRKTLLTVACVSFSLLMSGSLPGAVANRRRGRSREARRRGHALPGRALSSGSGRSRAARSRKSSFASVDGPTLYLAGAPRGLEAVEVETGLSQMDASRSAAGGVPSDRDRQGPLPGRRRPAGDPQPGDRRGAEPREAALQLLHAGLPHGALLYLRLRRPVCLRRHGGQGRQDLARRDGRQPSGSTWNGDAHDVFHDHPRNPVRRDHPSAGNHLAASVLAAILLGVPRWRGTSFTSARRTIISTRSTH